MKTQTENNGLNENVEMAVVEEIILPEEEYQSAHDKRKKVRQHLLRLHIRIRPISTSAIYSAYPRRKAHNTC